ncbi:putative PEP-binding protein [Shigella flexneri]
MKKNWAAVLIAVGLYRTEIPFMLQSDFRRKKNRWRGLRGCCKCSMINPVAFRTLDVGASKQAALHADRRKRIHATPVASDRITLNEPEILLNPVRAMLVLMPLRAT